MALFWHVYICSYRRNFYIPIVTYLYVHLVNLCVYPTRRSNLGPRGLVRPYTVSLARGQLKYECGFWVCKSLTLWLLYDFPLPCKKRIRSAEHYALVQCCDITTDMVFQFEVNVWILVYQNMQCSCQQKWLFWKNNTLSFYICSF